MKRYKAEFTKAFVDCFTGYFQIKCLDNGIIKILSVLFLDFIDEIK